MVGPLHITEKTSSLHTEGSIGDLEFYWPLVILDKAVLEKVAGVNHAVGG